VSTARACRWSSTLLIALALTWAPRLAAATSCAPVPAGLVGWWRLDGNPGDVTGQHPGAVTGGSFVPGEVSQGLACPNPGEGVEVPDDPALSPPQFTIDLWARIDDLPEVNPSLIWKGSASGANVSSPYGLGVYGTSGGPPGTAGLPVLTVGYFPSGSQAVVGNVTIPIGTFFHLAATADGTTLSLYLDGQLVGSQPQQGVPVDLDHPLQIGAVTVPGAINPGPNVIDEVELHDRAATAAEIQAIYVAGAEGKCLATPAKSSTWGSLKILYAK